MKTRIATLFGALALQLAAEAVTAAHAASASAAAANANATPLLERSAPTEHGASGDHAASGERGASGERVGDALAHDIFKQLIEINTTDSVGNVTTAAEAMAKRFLA